MDSGAIKQRSEEYIKLKRSFLEDTKSIRSGNVNDDKIESFVETMKKAKFRC